MSSAKLFHIGDILTITTGKLVSPRHMDGVYDILNHMTGDNLYTHQLVRAMQACRSALLQDRPYLARWGEQLEAGLKELDNPTIQQIMLLLYPFVQEVGCSDLNVLPLSEGEWLRVDPIKELGAMVGDEKVIVVNPEDFLG